MYGSINIEQISTNEVKKKKVSKYWRRCTLLIESVLKMGNQKCQGNILALQNF